MPEPDDDPRAAFVYQEALRGLTQQQTMVGDLHLSAGTLIFAASFASSLLGSRALSDGLQAWDWTGVVLLFAIGTLAVVMLWPYYNFWSRFDVEELLSQYLDVEAPVTMTEMHRGACPAPQGLPAAQPADHPQDQGGLPALPDPPALRDPRLAALNRGHARFLVRWPSTSTGLSGSLSSANVAANPANVRGHRTSPGQGAKDDQAILYEFVLHAAPLRGATCTVAADLLPEAGSRAPVRPDLAVDLWWS